MTARPSYDYRGLSRLVRGKVDALGIGYRAAADQIGVTASDLSRISADQSIAFEKVVAICDWCDVPERLFYEAPLPRAADPACGRAAPAGRRTSDDGRSALPASPDASTESNCCSAAHVKHGSKRDRIDPVDHRPRPLASGGFG